jgi:hypothetical protein
MQNFQALISAMPPPLQETEALNDNPISVARVG